MIIKDVIDVTKSGIAQLIAAGYMSEEYELTETNTAVLVDLGKTIEGDIKAADIFLGAIVDKCARMASSGCFLLLFRGVKGVLGSLALRVRL